MVIGATLGKRTKGWGRNGALLLLCVLRYERQHNQIIYILLVIIWAQLSLSTIIIIIIFFNKIIVKFILHIYILEKIVALVPI